MASLCKRPRSPFWWAFWRDEHGRAHNRSTKQRNKKDAQRIADLWEEVSKRRKSATHLRNVFNQLYRDAFAQTLPGITFRQYSDKWLSEKRIETSVASVHAYTATVNRFLEFLGDRAEEDLALISRDDIVKWRAGLAGHIHHVTANRHIGTLRSLFKDAKRDSYITENPAELIAAVAAKSIDSETDRRPFSLSEIQAIVSLANDEWRSLIRFGFFTGQRLGDLATLRWSNIDLAKNEIRFVARKTRRRVVLPLPEPLREHILSLPTQDDPNAPLHPYACDIVTRHDGRVSALSGEFAELLRATGLRSDATPHSRVGGRSARRRKEALSFHSLRHSASTILSEAGVPSSVAQAFIGHDSSDVHESYITIGMSALRDAAARLPAI
jgi:integrase